MIHISIEAETAREAREQMRELLGKSSTIAMTKDGVFSVAYGEPESSAFAQTAAETTETSAPSEPVAAVQPEPDTPAVTAEQVRAALNELRKKKGTDALRAVFNRYHVASFPELEPGVYGALLTEVKEELKDA